MRKISRPFSFELKHGKITFFLILRKLKPIIADIKYYLNIFNNEVLLLVNVLHIFISLV